MLTITLPDGQDKQFDAAISINDIAASIAPGLAKSAIAGKIDDRVVDTDFIVEHDAKVTILTPSDDEGLEVIRHSTAHLLAHAVKELYPEVQVTIGPVIENGFFYDFSYPEGFKPEDLKKIEKKMKELAKQKHTVTHQQISRDEAIKLFEGMGEHYKVQIIKDIPEDQILTIYQQDNFVDLCRGPHAPSTGHLKAFKLTKLAGAYWRGDSNNEMLQRIYGTAWPDKTSLKDYLHRVEEAEKRDHRLLAKKMKLFHLQEEAPGMVFWHARGWTLYQIVQQYMRESQLKHGYQEIRTPQLVDKSLWLASGHISKFGDEMFYSSSENREYAVKPMSCPCHVQIFNQGLHSYRELPIRFSEFGNCHRNEPSGALHGLMRVRGFTQDDGHIFCTEDQIAEEISKFIQQLLDVYRNFGFEDVSIKFSTRPDKRVGADEIWDKAEQVLEQVLNESGLPWDLQPGEGAFYGPKIEFALKDCLGRIWQCGTMQLDFSMPERLGAHYVTEDSSRKTPVMLHRAILGSLERFIGILLEEYAGNLPLWLAPVQAVVMTITDQQRDYAQNIQEMLKNNALRVTSDLRNEKIGYKIREHTIKRVPYLLVIGDQELKDKTVSLRTQAGKNLGNMTLPQLTEYLTQEANVRGKTVRSNTGSSNTGGTEH